MTLLGTQKEYEFSLKTLHLNIGPPTLPQTYSLHPAKICSAKPGQGKIEWPEFLGMGLASVEKIIIF